MRVEAIFPEIQITSHVTRTESTGSVACIERELATRPGRMGSEQRLLVAAAARCDGPTDCFVGSLEGRRRSNRARSAIVT